VNGQIHDGSARPLHTGPTRARPRRTCDPRRFPSLGGASRPFHLAVAASVALVALLTGVPRDAPGVTAAILAGGAWLSLVLAMTLPSRNERAGQELVRRLAQFRHELNAIGDSPAADALERLVRRAAELELREEDIHDELEQLRACADAAALKSSLARTGLPVVEPLDPLPPGDACHFVCPVRFGRRRSDQFGHLILSAGWLRFRGALDVSVAWSEVAHVRRDGREIVVSLRESRRMLRFSCQTFLEAARGGAIAEHLASASIGGQPPRPAEHPAAL